MSNQYPPEMEKKTRDEYIKRIRQINKRKSCPLFILQVGLPILLILKMISG